MANLNRPFFFLTLLLSLSALANPAPVISVDTYCYMPGLYEAGGTKYDLGLPPSIDLQNGHSRDFPFLPPGGMAPYATGLDMTYRGEFEAVSGRKTVLEVVPHGSHAFYWDRGTRQSILHKVWLTKGEKLVIRLMDTDLGQGSYGSNSIFCELTLN